MAELYVTPLSPGRPNYGRAIGALAVTLGTPLMPWQRHVAALSTELLPDGSWAYDTIVTTVPRQAGKTTVRAPIALHRCMLRPMGKCWLTAQTRQDARDIVVDDAGPRFNRSPLRRLGKLRKSQGSEGIYFDSGSFWRVYAPAEDALHGKANEIADVDEMWAFDAVQGAELEQAILPTFTTTGGQFTGVSTAGHAGSEWLWSYVLRGRAAVEAGAREGIAYVEHGLPTELADQVLQDLTNHGPGDPEWELAIQLVTEHHPAYGYTVKPRAIRAAAMGKDMRENPAAFLRAYGNVWSDTVETLIPAATWRGLALEHPEREQLPARFGLGLAAGIDRRDAALVAAWRTHTGRPHVRVLAYRDGISWAADQLDAIKRTYPAALAGCAGAGPVLEVADALKAHHRRDVERLKAQDYSTACSTMLSLILDGALAHDGDQDLAASVGAAVKRTMPSGGWAWDRVSAAGSIALLEAATVAVRLFDHGPAQLEAPEVR